MARPLSKTLEEVVRTSGKNASKLHVRLLDAFEREGQKATVEESVTLLKLLRRARDSFGESARELPEGPRALMQQWSATCSRHQGFRLLRERLFVEDGLAALPNSSLSVAYNTLRRLSLPEDAEQLWPELKTRVRKGQMDRLKELLGVWSVAPMEHMTILDKALAASVDKGQVETWQLLGLVARAGDWPQAAAVARAARRLERMLPELNSQDLALLQSQLGGTRTAGELPPSVKGIVPKVKALLLQRDGKLEPLQLCGLLPSLEDGFQDALWPMVRRQLLQTRGLSPQQLLGVCRFLHQNSGGRSLTGKERELYSQMTRGLQAPLKSRVQPGLVALVGKELPCLVADRKVCEELLSAAVTLRRDLYPGVLWRLFVQCGEADLVRHHPKLKSRLQVVGQRLEEHGVGEQMALSEMAAVAQAMLRTGVVLEKSTEQMVSQSLGILRRTQSEAEGPDSRWHAEAQKLIVSLWTHLKKLDAKSVEALDTAVVSFCGRDGDCRLPVDLMVSLTEDLGDLQDVEEVREGLQAHLSARLPVMSAAEILDTAAGASSSAMRKLLAAEMGRRLGPLSHLKRQEHFDHVISVLELWSQWLVEDPQAEVSLPELQRVASIACAALPTLLSRDAASAGRRLSRAAALFANLEPEALPLQQLRQALSAVSTAPLAGEAAELAFAMSALHGGKLPLDLSLRLWRLTGSAVAKLDGPLPRQQMAYFWAFALGTRELSSRSAMATLSLLPEAPAVETFIERAKAQEKDCTFPLEPVAFLDQFRPALHAVLQNKPHEERFTVPNTPYMVDAALPEEKLLVLVPRARHRALGSEGLSGSARLMERTLQAMGWQLRWVMPEDWSERLATLNADDGDMDSLLPDLQGLLRDPALAPLTLGV